MGSSLFCGALRLPEMLSSVADILRNEGSEAAETVQSSAEQKDEGNPVLTGTTEQAVVLTSPRSTRLLLCELINPLSVRVFWNRFPVTCSQQDPATRQAKLQHPTAMTQRACCRNERY